MQYQDKKFIYVVNSDNTVKSREITIMAQNDGKNFVVTSGLQPSERIVTDAVLTLKDGMTIKPITAAQAAKNRAKAADDLKNGKM